MNQTPTSKTIVYFAEILERLQVFDPTEVTRASEMSQIEPQSILATSIYDADELMRDARVQLEQENFSLLEYAVHQLRAISISIGFERLAYLFEQIFRNLSKLKLDYLRELFVSAASEFAEALAEAHRYCTDLEGTSPNHQNQFPTPKTAQAL